MKHLPPRLLTTFTAVSIALAALAAPVHAEEQEKTIEIFADKGKEITVQVVTNGDKDVIVLTPEEAANPAIVEEKLAHLDPEDKESAMQALSSIGGMHAKMMKIRTSDSDEEFVWHSDDGETTIVEFEIDDGGTEKHIERHIEKRVMKIKGGEGHHMVFAGDESGSHSDIVISLIDAGEFTRDQLDAIQAALDKKR